MRRVAVVPGTDTVFVAAEGAATVVGIDPATGAQKFSVPMQTGAWNNAVYDAIVAGDGYAYVAYGYADGSRTIHLMLLRVNGAGASNQMDVDDFPDIYPGGENTSINQIAVNMITNADQGVLISWVVDRFYEEAGTYQFDAVPRVRQRPLWAPMDVTVDVDGFVSVGMAVSNGTSVTAVNPPTIPGQGSHVVPMVQLQDGSFVGVIGANSQGGYYIGPALQAACVGYPGVTCPEGVQRDMTAFDASGNVKWVVPNETPQIATDDGGVGGQSGIKYDASGAAIGQIPTLPTYSWLGYAYQIGSVIRVNARSIYATDGFWSSLGANPSGFFATILGPWFPPLADCTRIIGGCAAGAIGQQEALYNALFDLVSRLAQPDTASLAQTQVFNKLADPSHHYAPTTADFILYLMTRRPGFFDATRSTYCRGALVSGFEDILCRNPITNLLLTTSIKTWMAGNSGTDAITATPHDPLWTFWRPSSVLFSSLGKNLGNAGAIFHEALHGFTGLYDRNPVSRDALIEKLGIDDSPASCWITKYIQANVLSFQGLDQTVNICN